MQKALKYNLEILKLRDLIKKKIIDFIKFIK